MRKILVAEGKLDPKKQPLPKKDDPMLAGLDLPQHRKFGRPDQVAWRRNRNAMIRRGLHPGNRLNG